jgi:hypothetical protein
MMAMAMGPGMFTTETEASRAMTMLNNMMMAMDASEMCMTTAQSLIQCHMNGPAGTVGWMAPNLDSLHGASTPPACCQYNLHEACGTVDNFLDLWMDNSMYSPMTTRILMEYMGACPAGEWPRGKKHDLKIVAVGWVRAANCCEGFRALRGPLSLFLNIARC